MSDPKSSLGEPVEEPTSVDEGALDVEESLADAEAAGRGAASSSDLDPSIYGSVVDDGHVETVPVAPVASAETVVVEPAASDAATTAYAASEAETVVVTPSEPVVVEPVVAAPVVAPAASAQPIFVQAPEAPRPRGNRAAAGAIGVLAALSFAVLYLGAWLGFGAIAGEVTGENIGAQTLAAVGTWGLWIPVVVFFVAFWLLGAIINRGRWGVWVIFGLLVGAASYGGHLLGQLFEAPFWNLTAREGAELVDGQLLAPLAIAAFIFGRELTIWFGAWVSARGKRVTELNVEAQREYERTLEAGPQLVRG